MKGLESVDRARMVCNASQNCLSDVAGKFIPTKTYVFKTSLFRDEAS